MKNNSLKNLEMNNNTYELRHRVMTLIYEAKVLVPSLPRIALRITENSSEVNGMARMNKNMVWIPANSSIRDMDKLRRTVYHEILHAAYGIDHVESCKLMGSVYNDISKAEAEKLFVKYAKSS